VIGSGMFGATDALAILLIRRSDASSIEVPLSSFKMDRCIEVSSGSVTFLAGSA